MKRIIPCAAAIVLIAFSITRVGLSFGWNGSSVTAPAAARVMMEGEELVYEVSWYFVKLGTIRTKILKANSNSNTMIRYSAMAYVDSYEGLPFADLHSVSYTGVDKFLSSRATRTLEKKGDEWWALNYAYDLPNKRLIIETTWQKDLNSAPYKSTGVDTLMLQDTTFQDGFSIAYFARSQIGTEQAIRVPTVMYENLGTTTFWFTNQKSTKTIDALERPIRVVELEGTLDVKGIFGLIGDFKGWFSDDSAAVPIKAEMNVILGVVDLELIEWDRDGWNPPIAAE